MDLVPEEYFFKDYPLIMEVIAGGCCGLAVDSFLFPIDTCKTRLQSEKGFWRAGGFKGIYNGLGPALTGSIPIAALFFTVYSCVQKAFPDLDNQPIDPVLHFFYKFLINLFAATLGEMCADLIRVPVEIVKQKRQVSKIQYRSIDILMEAYNTEGLINGVYRGYGITIMRDIPFSMIQYPLWEFLKAIKLRTTKTEPSVFLSACFGSISGAVASAVTTPLDVAKTRIQLLNVETNEENIRNSRNPFTIWKQLYKENGIQGVFGGFVPRVLWTTIGGFIWFGVYSLVIYLLKQL